MKNVFCLLLTFLMISFISIPNGHGLITGHSLSANGSGQTYTGNIVLNHWGSLDGSGYCKVEDQTWTPSGPPCVVAIELSVTYTDTANIGGTISGSIEGTSAVFGEPGVLVGNWDDGAPRPMDGSATIVFSTEPIDFPGRNTAHKGTCQEWDWGYNVYNWEASGEVVAQRAYDLAISSTTETTSSSASIGTDASVGVSESTGKTQGEDWDFGQSITMSVPAANQMTTGTWAMDTNYTDKKACLKCGESVQTKFEHRRICGEEEPGIIAGCGEPYWICPDNSDEDDHKVRTCIRAHCEEGFRRCTNPICDSSLFDRGHID